MQKIKASGIPFCGSYRDAIAEKEYNIDQCNVRIAELEAINAELLAALEAAAELAEGAVKLLRQLDMESGRIAAECVLRDARAAIARATGGNAS